MTRMPRDGTKIGDSRAYGGYIVRLTLHGFSVLKDGIHITWATSFDDAVVKIDALTLTTPTKQKRVSKSGR